MKLHSKVRLYTQLYLVREMLWSWTSMCMYRAGLIKTASKLNYAASLEKARMDAITATVGNAGKLYFYGGTQPAGPGTTHAQTLIVGPFTLGSPFAPGATTALPSVLSPTLPSNVNAAESAQATWARVTDSSGTDGGAGLIDFSAGTSECDITIGPTTAGQPVAITSWTVSSATYGH